MIIGIVFTGEPYLPTGLQPEIGGSLEYGFYSGMMPDLIEVNTVYLHLAMETSNGEKPTCIKHDGVDKLTITGPFRADIEEDSAIIIPATFSSSWKLPIRGFYSGVYIIFEVSTTNGVADDIEFTTTQQPDICNIDPSDFIDIKLISKKEKHFQPKCYKLRM